jgi:hypothetical protein
MGKRKRWGSSRHNKELLYRYKNKSQIRKEDREKQWSRHKKIKDLKSRKQVKVEHRVKANENINRENSLQKQLVQKAPTNL